MTFNPIIVRFKPRPPASSKTIFLLETFNPIIVRFKHKEYFKLLELRQLLQQTFCMSDSSVIE